MALDKKFLKSLETDADKIEKIIEAAKADAEALQAELESVRQERDAAKADAEELRLTHIVFVESGLNLREKPSKDAAILSLLPNGAAVTIDPAVETPEGWAAVKGGGYVMREFLK